MRLLVVDDSATSRNRLKALLEQLGHTVLLAASGAEARKCLANDPELDGLLLDMLMPGEDGISFLRLLRAEARWKTLPVMMVTTQDQLDNIQVALATGANEYVTKPVSEATLSSKLELLALYRQDADTTL